MTSFNDTLKALREHGQPAPSPYTKICAKLRKLADDIEADDEDALAVYLQWAVPKYAAPSTRPVAEIRAEIARLESLTQDTERAAHAIRFLKWTIGEGEIELFDAGRASALFVTDLYSPPNPAIAAITARHDARTFQLDIDRNFQALIGANL